VETTGVTAGLAAGLSGLLAISLCVLAVVFGIVALRRIRRDNCGGRGLAWTGIILSCLPLAVLVAYLVYMLPTMWHELRNELNNLGRRKEKFAP
jgi:hypothetical protein